MMGHGPLGAPAWPARTRRSAIGLGIGAAATGALAACTQ
jgi:hypothetical protein